MTSTGRDDGTGSDAGSKRDTEDREHLARSRRVWDRWSHRYGLSERDFEPVRVRAIERLDLAAGDRVLDVGCGPGVNFTSLREAVGSSGEVVGIDYSPGMVERARARVGDRGWENVAVRRADATTATLGSGFDAATATLSLSVMPDVDRAVANVHSALPGDGRLAVVDLRPVPSGPARALNPLIRRCLRWVANWNPDGDVVASLRATFETVEVYETRAAGTAFAALATDDTLGRDPDGDASATGSTTQ